MSIEEETGVQPDDLNKSSKDSKYTIIFKNGAKLEFEAGWNFQNGFPGINDLLTHVTQFQMHGKVPDEYNQPGSAGIRYRIRSRDSNKFGATIVVDVREVVSISWVQ